MASECSAKDKKLNILATTILNMGELLLVLKLRFRQFWRLILTVGWLWVVALPILFVFFLVLLNDLQAAHPILIYIFAFLASVSFHYSRKDAPFLKKMGYNILLIYGTEYFLLSLIILLPVAMLYGQWLLLLLSPAGAVALALAPIKKTYHYKAPLLKVNFIPLKYYEWIAGIRKNGWGLAIIYVLGLAGAYWIAPPLIAILLLSAVLPGFYDHCEPKEWMETFFSKPNYLLKKSIQHAVLLLLFLLPLMISFLAFSTEYWYLLLIAILASLLYLFFLIFYKYANYYPGRRKVQNGTISGLMVLGLFLPFTAPVGIIYIFLLFIKAQNRLELYLNR